MPCVLQLVFAPVGGYLLGESDLEVARRSDARVGAMQEVEKRVP